MKVFFFSSSLFFSFLSNSDKGLSYKTNAVFSYVLVGSIVVMCQGRRGLTLRKEASCRNFGWNLINKLVSDRAQWIMRALRAA